MEGQSPAGIDVRRYLTVVRRHILLIAVLTIALGVAAYGYSASKTPMYEATAQLLYAPQLNVSDPLNTQYTDPTTQELQMQSAVTIITGPTIDKLVMAQIPEPAVVPDYSVSAAVTTSDAAAQHPGRQRRRGDRRLHRRPRGPPGSRTPTRTSSSPTAATPIAPGSSRPKQSSPLQLAK